MDLSTLQKSGTDVLHLMPSHQYPTGLVTSIARRYALLSWAAERPGRYLIEDDFDCEFRLAGKPIPALGIDRCRPVGYLHQHVFEEPFIGVAFGVYGVAR